MRKYALLFFIFITFDCYAISRPKGTTSCSGSDCTYHEVPLGTELEKKVKDERSNGLAKPIQDKTPRTTKRNASRKEAGNLPSYYWGVNRTHYESSEKVVFVPKNQSAKIKGISAGDVVHALVEQSVKASLSVPTPVRALILSGKLKGAYFIGEAILDRELKRVLLQFSKLKTKSRLYETKAKGLALSGQVGLEGEFYSETGKFFLAELASATAAGIADSTIQRSQTSDGHWVEAPSLTNSAKQGAVAALSRTADRAAESVRSAPEFTEIKGFQEIQILIEQTPVEEEQ